MHISFIVDPSLSSNETPVKEANISLPVESTIMHVCRTRVESLDRGVGGGHLMLLLHRHSISCLPVFTCLCPRFTHWVLLEFSHLLAVIHISCPPDLGCSSDGAD